MENSNFIGKGKQVKGRIQVNIKMSDAEPFISEYKGEKYLNCTLFPLKQKDQFGKTHTITGYKPEEKPAEA